MSIWRENFTKSVTCRNLYQTIYFENLIQKYNKLYQQFLVNYLQINKYELRLNELAEKSDSSSPRGSTSSTSAAGGKKGAKSEGVKELEDRIFLLEKELRENLETKLQQSKQILKLNEQIKTLQTEFTNYESSKKILVDENIKLKAISSELEYQNEKFQKKIKAKETQLEKVQKELYDLRKTLQEKEQETMQNAINSNQKNMIILNNCTDIPNTGSPNPDDSLVSYFDSEYNKSILKSYNSQNSAFEGQIPLKPHIETAKNTDFCIKSIKLLPHRNNSHHHNHNKLQFFALNQNSSLGLWEYQKLNNSLICKQKIFAGPSNTELMRLDVSNDGKLVCAASEDGSTKVWTRSNNHDVSSSPKYMFLTTLTGHTKPVHSCCFSTESSNNIIVTGSEDSTIKVFDVNQYESPYLMTIGGNPGVGNIPSAVNDLDIQKNILASGHADGSVVFHDLRSCECINTITTHCGEVTCLKFANFNQNSNNLLISLSQDGLFNLLDLRTFTSLATLSDPSFENNYFSTDFAVSPCGRYVSAFGSSGKLFIWDLMQARDRIGSAAAILDCGFSSKTPAIDWGFIENNNEASAFESVIVGGGFDKRIVIIN